MGFNERISNISKTSINQSRSCYDRSFPFDRVGRDPRDELLTNKLQFSSNLLDAVEAENESLKPGPQRVQDR